jgi:hypothetical protein
VVRVGVLALPLFSPTAIAKYSQVTLPPLPTLESERPKR